jgi:hypothetical protein
LHHEIQEFPSSVFRDDEVVSHVASSLENAIGYIKELHVDPYSWWEIIQYPIDTTDWLNWPKSLGYYGRRAGKLKAAPIQKAIAIYKRCKADPEHPLKPRWLASLRAKKKKS